MNYEDNTIPTSWAWVDIGGLGVFLGGGTPAKSVKEYWDSADVPWVSPKDMKQDNIHSAEMSVSKKALDETSLSRIPKGSLIMVTRSGILSRTFPVAINHCDVVINQDLKALVPFSGVNAKFLMLMCQYCAHQILADCSKQGTTVASINTSSLQGYKVPLAPTPEQHRIVAKIEALFSEIDHGVEELKAAQKKLKRARQALLKAAFEGKLTARWRAENPDKLESPEVLRQRIQEEREAYYQCQLAEWEKAVEAWKAGGSEGRKPRKPKPPEPLLVESCEDTENISSLPAGWLWCRVGGLLAEGPTNGKSVKDKDGGFPVLRLTAMSSSSLDLEEYKEGAWSRTEALSYVVKEGDFFVVRGNGSKSLVGVGRLARKVAREVAYPDTMIKMRPLESLLSGRFLDLVWRSLVLRRQIESSARTTAGIYKINQQQIRSFFFPLPGSLEEQSVLMKLLEENLSNYEDLEENLSLSLQRAESLKQSILKQAFSGRLVSQDPDDEPASALLARIRAEREAQQQAAPRRRRRKPTAEASPL
ncbi:restriction endonuclease subunit S [uncultured Halomonas sp.]|uniref:restriction endonuclease subunit S n=1 Tax=uncultured Halomonas sp. TaxID=173971 RepID=UPI00261E3A9E|nr:restriction endonuclease subunit S [uncultured Halomonas sp.]